MVRRISAALVVCTFGTLAISVVRPQVHADSATHRVTLPKQHLRPGSLAMDPGGTSVFVALNRANRIVEMDLKQGRIVREFPTGKLPKAVAISHGALCVVDDDRSPLVIPLGGGDTRRVPLPNLPKETQIALTHEPPGWLAWLLGSLPVPQSAIIADPCPQVRLQPLNNQHTAQQLRAIGPFRHAMSIPLQTGIDTDRRLFVNRGGAVGFSGALGFAGGGSQPWDGSAAALASQSRLTDVSFTVPLDLENRAAVLPSAALYHAGRDVYFVTASSSDCILVIDGSRLRAFLLDEVNAGSDLPGLAARYVVDRIATPGFPGPMALSLDGKTLVVANVLDDSLSIIECNPTPRLLKTIPLSQKIDDAVSRGERLFHSASLSKSSRFACASCHPGGHMDGLEWAMPGDELGFRTTKTLRGAAQTAPYGWRGDDATLEVHIRHTLKHLFQHEPMDREIADLTAYIQSLPPLPGDELSIDAPNDVVQGQVVFHSTGGCVRCHSGRTMQDGKTHDVGTGGHIDTPSLRGLALRTKFLHDGRADFPAHIFQAGARSRNEKDCFVHEPHRHGNYTKLSDEEQRHLIAFLATLR